MKSLRIYIGLLAVSVLSGCALWNSLRPLDSDEKKRIEQYTVNAKQYYDGGHYAQALQQAQKGLEIDDSDERLLFLLGWIHLKLDTKADIWKAEEYFDELDTSSWFKKADWGTVLGHGLVLRRQGDFLRAAGDQAAKEASVDSSKLKLAERGRREGAQKYKEAAEKLEEALELNPEGTEAIDGLQQIYAIQGDYEKSLTYGKKFIDIASRSRILWEKQLQRNDVPASEEKVVRAKIESNRRRETASRSLAANHLYKQKRFEEAIEQLDVLLTLDPEQSEEYFNRALCKEGIKNLPGAVKDLEIFLKKTPLGFESTQVRKAYDLISLWNREIAANPAETPK